MKLVLTSGFMELHISTGSLQRILNIGVPNYFLLLKTKMACNYVCVCVCVCVRVRVCVRACVFIQAYVFVCA